MKRLWEFLRQTLATFSVWSMVFTTSPFLLYSKPVLSTTSATEEEEGATEEADGEPVTLPNGSAAVPAESIFTTNGTTLTPQSDISAIGACPTITNPFGSPASEETTGAMPGSTFFRSCQGHAQPSWIRMFTAYVKGEGVDYAPGLPSDFENVSDTEQFQNPTLKQAATNSGDWRASKMFPESGNFSGIWANLYTEFKADMQQIRESDQDGRCVPRSTFQEISQKLRDYADRAQAALYQERKCYATLFLTTAKRDISEQPKRRKGQDYKSFDNKIKCQDLGPEVQDYFVCKTMVEAYNVTAVAKKVHEATQTVRVLDKNNDIKNQVIEDLPNDATAALKGQEEAVRVQADMANERAVADTTRATILGGFATQFPTLDSIVNKCNKKIGVSNGRANKIGIAPYIKFIGLLVDWRDRFIVSAIHENVRDESKTWGKSREYIQGLLTNANEVFDPTNYRTRVGQAGDICNLTAGDGTVSLIFNGNARQQAIAAAANAGIDAFTNVAKGQILNNEADRIRDAYNGVEEFDPELLPFQGDDALIAKCTAEPTLPECSGFAQNGQFGFSNQGITISPGGRATTGGTFADKNLDDGLNAAGENAGGDRSGILDDIGAPVTSIAKKGGLSNTPGAARYRGGGNKGGGGGGASPGGGGGASLSQGGEPGQKPPSRDGDGNSRRVAKYGGGNTTYKYAGGNGKSGGSNAKPSNPFANLFGNKKKKGNKNGVLNFRQPAAVAGKGSSLFGIISRRYGVVDRRGQLHRYEKK